MGRCIVCGYCAEACHEDAIETSCGLELATPSLDSLIYCTEFLVREPLERERGRTPPPQEQELRRHPPPELANNR